MMTTANRLLKEQGIKNATLGIVRRCSDCCREIRIQMPGKVGTIYQGYNGIAEESEHWIVIKNHKDYNDTVLQRVHFT